MTRVQTLQMLSTLLPDATAGASLEERAELLSAMDQIKNQVQLLLDNNRKMQADLKDWEDGETEGPDGNVEGQAGRGSEAKDRVGEHNQEAGSSKVKGGGGDLHSMLEDRTKGEDGKT